MIKKEAHLLELLEFLESLDYVPFFRIQPTTHVVPKTGAASRRRECPALAPTVVKVDLQTKHALQHQNNCCEWGKTLKGTSVGCCERSNCSKFFKEAKLQCTHPGLSWSGKPRKPTATTTRFETTPRPVNDELMSCMATTRAASLSFWGLKPKTRILWKGACEAATTSAAAARTRLVRKEDGEEGDDEGDEGDGEGDDTRGSRTD